VSKLQKDDGLTLVLIITAVLIYFISYFFIYIFKDPIKIITVDYTTALMSLIPPIVFLSKYLFSQELKVKFVTKIKQFL
jgi:hypothetical protein